MSIDPGARLEAIKAIEEKSDPQFVPQLIKLLNDTTSVEDRNTRVNSQISEAAKSRVNKNNEGQHYSGTRKHGNVHSSVSGRATGSHAEKIGVIDILSVLREPVAYPLLKQISENRDRPQIALRASDAMRSLIPKSVTANNYRCYLETNRIYVPSHVCGSNDGACRGSGAVETSIRQLCGSLCPGCSFKRRTGAACSCGTGKRRHY